MLPVLGSPFVELSHRIQPKGEELISLGKFQRRFNNTFENAKGTKLRCWLNQHLYAFCIAAQ